MDREIPLPASLTNVRESEKIECSRLRLRAILPLFQTIMELFKILPNSHSVFRVGHTIHARAGIFPKTFECLLQRFDRQKMSDR